MIQYDLWSIMFIDNWEYSFIVPKIWDMSKTTYRKVLKVLLLQMWKHNIKNDTEIVKIWDMSETV